MSDNVCVTLNFHINNAIQQVDGEIFIFISSPICIFMKGFEPDQILPRGR